MNNQAGTVQNTIDSILEERFQAMEREIDIEIEQSKEKMESGSIPTAGEACEIHIKNMRMNMLSRYSELKTWFLSSILGLLNRNTKSEELYQIAEKNKELRLVNNEKKKIEGERDRVLKNENKLSDYDRFLLYGRYKQKKIHGQKQKNTDILQSDRLEAIDITPLHRKYRTTKWSRIVVGIIVALICAVADYNIIFSVFQSSNLSVDRSMLTATLSALALDLPPYILGLLISQRSDRVRLWQLRDDVDDPGAESEIKGYSRAIIILLIAIILLFTVYFALRVILFLGGGDFNTAMHSIINGKLKFDTTIFNSADLMSTFIPLGTSAVSFAVGLMLDASYTDYVKEMILFINNELDSCKRACDDAVSDCDTKIRNLEDEIEELKHSAWATYMGIQKRPEDNEIFFTQIVNTYIELNLPLYRQAYQSGSAQIRDRAYRMLGKINTVLAPYATNQNAIETMEVAKNENAVLDEIWVTGEEILQSSSTKKALEEIDKQVNQYRQILNNQPEQQKLKEGDDPL